MLLRPLEAGVRAEWHIFKKSFLSTEAPATLHTAVMCVINQQASLRLGACVMSCLANIFPALVEHLQPVHVQHSRTHGGFNPAPRPHRLVAAGSPTLVAWGPGCAHKETSWSVVSKHVNEKTTTLALNQSYVLYTRHIFNFVVGKRKVNDLDQGWGFISVIIVYPKI